MSATRPATKTELKNYALRRLGFPAIDINVCDEQLDDLIEEAIDYYQEFHFNGSYTAFVRIEVTDAIKTLKPLRAVYGNIDGATARLEFPLHNRFLCEQVDVWITHIGGYPGKYNINIREDIKMNPPKIFIAGHSHILKVQFDKKLQCLHLNPGAAGKHGFHKVRTMIRFEIDGKDIKNMEIIELEQRQ